MCGAPCTVRTKVVHDSVGSLMQQRVTEAQHDLLALGEDQLLDGLEGEREPQLEARVIEPAAAQLMCDRWEQLLDRGESLERRLSLLAR